MRRPLEIEKERATMGSIVQLTAAFEGIASAHIARIKDEVKRSQSFFAELWPIYTNLRVSKQYHQEQAQRAPADKELIILITAEGSLSGDIDIRLVEEVLAQYKPSHQDIVVIGHHGATLLRERKVSIRRAVALPTEGDDLDAAAVLSDIQEYRSATVYYQAYVSLMAQEIKQINLSAAVEERGEKASELEEGEDLISDANYIFEPTVTEVVMHMERSMLGVALSEVILESKLAQQASRFRAMSSARTRAKDSEQTLSGQLHHAKRSLKDERTREIVNTLRRRSVYS